MKTSFTVPVTHEIHTAVSNVLGEIGLTAEEAFGMFVEYIYENKALPFETAKIDRAKLDEQLHHTIMEYIKDKEPIIIGADENGNAILDLEKHSQHLIDWVVNG